MDEAAHGIRLAVSPSMTRPTGMTRLGGMTRAGRTVVMATVLSTPCLAAACGAASGPHPAPGPTTPSPPGGVTTVLVTSASATASMFHLVATARFSDGMTRDVTTSAFWESSNTSVAIVSQSGVLTIVATGSVNVRATYQGVTGSFPLMVDAPPPLATLRGTVWEVPPLQRPLPGARVEIMQGADAGTIAVSDSTGAYRFSGLHAGVLIVRSTLEGYQSWQGGFTLSGDSQQDAWLTPNPPRDGTGTAATARCRDGSWSWSRDITLACAANGGVAYFVCPGPFCDTTTQAR